MNYLKPVWAIKNQPKRYHHFASINKMVLTIGSTLWWLWEAVVIILLILAVLVAVGKI